MCIRIFMILKENLILRTVRCRIERFPTGKCDMYIQKICGNKKEGGFLHPLVVSGVDTRHFVQQVRAGRGKVTFAVEHGDEPVLLAGGSLAAFTCVAGVVVSAPDRHPTTCPGRASHRPCWNRCSSTEPVQRDCSRSCGRWRVRQWGTAGWQSRT